MNDPAAKRPFGWRGVVLEPVIYRQHTPGRAEWAADGIVLVRWFREDRYCAWFGKHSGSHCRTPEKALESARAAALVDVAEMVRLAHLTK